MSPTVSIILPAYQHEEFVGQTITSVLAQTYSDWELIVVDDCSPDSTWEVIQTFTDPRIRASRNPENLGVSGTYNAALAASRGDIIMALGSDDLFMPTKLEDQVRFFDENPTVSIVGTHLQVLTDDDDTRASVTSWFNTSEDLNQPDAWVWQNRLAQSSVAITRRAHATLGTSRTDLTRTPDWELWLRSVRLGLAMQVIPEPLTAYRVRGGSVTHADPVGTTIEYLLVSGEYWHDFLRQAGRTDLITSNLRTAFQRFAEASDDGKARIASALDPLLRREPETLLAIAGLLSEATATLEAKVWLEDQWQRQEQRADRLQAKLDRSRR